MTVKGVKFESFFLISYGGSELRKKNPVASGPDRVKTKKGGEGVNKSRRREDFSLKFKIFVDYETRQ